jgi:hypothetical protein
MKFRFFERLFREDEQAHGLAAAVSFLSRRGKTVVYTPGFSFDMGGLFSLVLYGTVVLVLTRLLIPREQ